MFVMMLISGIGGAFLYYAFLYGIATGGLELNRLSWSRCVGASALILASSATLVVDIFVTDTSMTTILLLWPVFVLALEPGYRLVKQITERSKDFPIDPYSSKETLINSA
jgi:hypothetical protein